VLFGTAFDARSAPNAAPGPTAILRALAHAHRSCAVSWMGRLFTWRYIGIQP
jgi:hypothetical protein